MIIRTLKKTLAHFNAFLLAKVIVYLGSISGILRELLSILIFFTPCLGLFDLLHHIKFEQIPFKARLEYAKNNQISESDEIKLRNMNETVYWKDLDNFNYAEDPPEPPKYTLYTYFRYSFKLKVFSKSCCPSLVLNSNFYYFTKCYVFYLKLKSFLSIQEFFILFFVWKVLQIIAIYLTKKCLSWGFKEEQSFTNKLIHVFNCINGPLPYYDWDETSEQNDEPYNIDRFNKQYR